MSVVTYDYSFLSPNCIDPACWNVSYSGLFRDGSVHYWVFSIDCNESYYLDGYDGQEFYSLKIFADGSLLYDTYYSKDQYDYLKNRQDSWNLKYFTLGRCTMANNGWWHYADMSVYAMRLYNRGLTEEEMLENYNVTRAYYSTISE